MASFGWILAPWLDGQPSRMVTYSIANGLGRYVQYRFGAYTSSLRCARHHVAFEHGFEESGTLWLVAIAVAVTVAWTVTCRDGGGSVFFL